MEGRKRLGNERERFFKKTGRERRGRRAGRDEEGRSERERGSCKEGKGRDKMGSRRSSQHVGATTSGREKKKLRKSQWRETDEGRK